jgi:DNA-binding transcriptional ArsR family regulator
MLEVAVIDDPAAAEVSLDPVRARLLAELAEPGSATMLAARVGLPRQKVNYHLRALERVGLVELVEERRKGNVTERMLRATAASYVISPAALADVAPDPARSPDRLSARWLLALASQLVRDMGALITAAAHARRPLATFALDGEVRFASAADRAAFAEELATSVATLISRYHDESAPGGRPHRIVVAIHPSVRPKKEV